NQTEKYIADKKFYQAKINVESLKTVLEFGIFPDLQSQLSWLKEVGNQIENYFQSEITDYHVKQGENPSVPKMISGTVTVWVDKGIRIEKGLGYSDISIGSGFFIDERGYIVTNYHVIESEVNPEYEGYSRLYIKTSEDSETKIPAKVVGYDSVMDLALLKAEITPKYVFQLGSSENLEIGDQIYAIGSPLGLEKTITSGIISTTDRKITTMGTVMQIDASVNAGNSGGPAVSKEGLVQGVVFAGIEGSQGLNFAIPVEYLKNEVFALYNGGEVLHPWLGFYGKTYKDVENQSEIGLEVFYVVPGTGASTTSIEKGSLITAFDGKTVENENQLQDLLISAGTNRITTITFGKLNADGKIDSETTELIFLEKRPEFPGIMILDSTKESKAFYPLFGMEIVPTSSKFKKEFLVTKVVKGSVADNAGFSENDPIKIVKTKVIEDGQYFYAEVFGKKRKNGYLEATMALTAPMDSSNFF
ncbi:MAG: S1C family serine protease, partial [Treponemataceae bacterium]|nr:S1C family serine protease [Treponemataceae bacterium]